MKKQVLVWALAVSLLTGTVLISPAKALAAEKNTSPGPIEPIAVSASKKEKDESKDESNDDDVKPDAYYNFEDVKGTAVHDESGNNNDASLVNNAIVRNNAQAGGNVAFLDNGDLSGEKAQGIELPSDLFTGISDFTLVMDTYLISSETWTGLLAAGSDTQHYMILANQGDKPPDGKCGLTCATLYGQQSSEEERVKASVNDKLPVGRWARVAFTQTAKGNSKLYIDGREVASGTLSTTLGQLAEEKNFVARIGSNTVWPDPGFNGLVDNVRIYKTVLTEDQISKIPWTISEEPKDPEFPELGKHGIAGDYCLFDIDDKNNSYTFGDYKSTYIDPNIDFENDSSFESILSKRTGASNNVGVRWNGRIAAPEDGNYTFYSYSDNGVKVWIDDKLIIDYWVNEWDEEQISKPFEMKKGEAHNIKIEYFEASGGQHVMLSWKDDQNIMKKPIPSTAFYLPENFEGALIDNIDTSDAQLDRKEGLDGTVKVTGTNLDQVSKLELITAGGASLEPAVYPKVDSKSPEEIIFELPTTLAAGMYKVKLSTEKGIITISDQSFSIIAAPGETDRPEHPRPDWERSKWMNLNGWWDFAYDKDAVGTTEKWYEDKEYELKINVPFPWESQKSGIGDDSYLGQAWYHRTMDLDDSWLGENKTVFMKFGAVDWNCTLYVNGKKVGDHTGGYDTFEFDITKYVNTGSNDIALRVMDNATSGGNVPALIGKQGHDAPCGYTQTSGIWQSVYIEGRTNTYLDYAHANPDVTKNTVTYDLSVVSNADQDVTVSYAFTGKKWDEKQEKDIENGSNFEGSQDISLKEGANTVKLDPIYIQDPKLWNLNDPNLYYGTITVKDFEGTTLDQVDTYFGLRQVTTQEYGDRNYKYVNVNGKPVFLSGLLDQGFWPEGIYTAPNEAALKDDIEALKERGFNLIRKHIKIEDPLEYYWCDKLGCFVWQDIPWGTQLNATSEGSETPGRLIYEQCMKTAITRDYNHPSIIAIILFNETWGINHNAPEADDGMTTNEWIQHLYNEAKSLNPNLMVEDMSACNNDHIQPTDQNTWHFYTNWQNAYNDIQNRDNNTNPGSANNFLKGYTQNGAPWLNSEYGGVGCGSGDLDVSWCFKYLTDALRLHQKLNGYIYTEPYDIEYERNGFRTYDRRNKIFGYDEIAYGGDMSMADLNQPDYIGVDINPNPKLAPGAEYSAKIAALNWSGRDSNKVVVKWRFDATDIYGNNFSTGISGSKPISYRPYTREDITINFKLPVKKCVGTLTVWLEDGGTKIAKNFVNVVVTDDKETPALEFLGDNSMAIRGVVSGTTAAKGTGTVTYNYPISQAFDINSLNNMRVIAEVSSVKGSTENHGVVNSDKSQTVEGGERPSDVTILVNGVEIETVYIPDDPRDIRGTIGLLSAYNGTSAKDYGYLININVPSEKIAAVKKAISASQGKIEVSYKVKTDAKNKNGVQIYTDTNGRYAVNPTVILNPPDQTLTSVGIPENKNYKVEAVLAEGQNVSVRGGTDIIEYKDGNLVLSNSTGELGESPVSSGNHRVAVKLFDDHIQVYADDNPVPVLDKYDYSKFTALTAQASQGVELTISGETYQEDIGEKDINKDSLNELIINVEKLLEKDYTQESWMKLQSALDEAKHAEDDSNASQEEISIAYHNLKNAISSLVPESEDENNNGSHSSKDHSKQETSSKLQPQQQLQQTYISDTTRDFSVSETYQFKITSKDGKAPTFVIGTPGVFEIESTIRNGNDYFIKLRAIGAPGDKAGIYINNGQRLLVATVGSNPNYVKFDTGKQLSVRAGKTYQFRVTAAKRPTFICGTGSTFRVTYVNSKGNDYFFKVTATGKVGDRAGFYVNSEKAPRTIGTIIS